MYSIYMDNESQIKLPKNARKARENLLEMNETLLVNSWIFFAKHLSEPCYSAFITRDY